MCYFLSVFVPEISAIFARTAPKLALIEASLPKTHDDALRLSAPEAPPLTVPVIRGSSAGTTAVRVWDDRTAAVDQGDAAAAWCETVTGVEGARLVRMADGERRKCSTKYAPRGSLTSFSDGFPVLLASEASLGDLNRRLVSLST